MKLAFCGLGLMGLPMAHRLLDAGHTLKVWNRTAAKAAELLARGAEFCDTPAAAASDVDGVLMCLYDAASVEAVAFGANGIAQARGLRWLGDHTSITPDVSRALAQRLQQTSGTVWYDAPVSGGVAGVRAGTLAVMAGGDLQHWAAFEAAVRAYAGNITHMGASGTGQAAKLCNQVIVASTVAAIAEAVGLARRNDIDPAKLRQALSGGWADSKPFQVFVPRMAQAQAQSIGALSTMLKDVDTIMAVAQTSGATMPMTTQVQALMQKATALGLGPAELSALVSVVLPELTTSFLKQVQDLAAPSQPS
jgi:2-hydroxy-3-oxopropionate reductase